MLRRPAGLLLAACLFIVMTGHVGSPDVWFSGDAGPYRLLVHVRSPGVVPGIAEVTVEVQGDLPDQVLVHVNRYDAVAAPPPPEVAEPVDGRSGTFRARLWVMTAGSNSVTVQVRGPRGDGKVVVPATIVPFRRLEFSGPLAGVLAVAGVVLFAGLVTIIGSAVREAVLPPGAMPDAKRRRRGLYAMAGTTLVLSLALLGGKRWWDAEDGQYRDSMFRALTAEAEVVRDAQSSMLVLVITDPSWMPVRFGQPLAAAARLYSPLVPDHGKLMHLFLVAEDGGALAHLHPETADTVAFRAALPPLPPGRYRLFGDVTHESGFAQTLTTSVALPEVPASRNSAAANGAAASRALANGSPAGDPRPAPANLDAAVVTDLDDSWLVGEPTGGTRAVLEDGSVMTWERGDEAIEAGVPAPLHFSVAAPDGTPAALEPYMGMAGHAVVVRDDGSVFIHLHPLGTISMSSQMAFELRTAADSLVGSLAPRLASADAERSAHATHVDGLHEVTFPYAFPSGGRYRVWVQVKREGRVLTGVFDAEVAEGSPET